MRAAPVIALGIFVAAFSFAAATHSASPCESEVTPIGLEPVKFYLVDAADGGIWLYQEVNGHPDLQRGGITWYAVGTGDHGIDYCWDVDLATGEHVESTDFIVI